MVSPRSTFALLAFITLAACSPGESSVTVVGPQPPRPKVEITTQPVALRQGGSDTVRIAIARTDYTGPVFVTFEGLPAGVRAPSVSSTSTNAFRIPLNADSNAALGVRTATITASGIDIPVVNIPLSVTVSSR